jgi:hypothetical protein
MTIEEIILWIVLAVAIVFLILDYCRQAAKLCKAEIDLARARAAIETLSCWIITDSGKLSRDWPPSVADAYFENLNQEVDQ